MPVKMAERVRSEQAENATEIAAFREALRLSKLTEAGFAAAMSTAKIQINEDQVHRWKGKVHGSGHMTVVPGYAMRLAAKAVGRSVDELYASVTGGPTINERRAGLQDGLAELLETARRIQAELGPPD